VSLSAGSFTCNDLICFPLHLLKSLSQYQEHASRGFVAASVQPFHASSLKASGVQLPAGIAPEKWDLFHSLIVADEMMRLPLGVNWALGGGNAIGAPPLAAWGSEELKRELLPDVYKGAKRFCLVSLPLRKHYIAASTQAGFHAGCHGAVGWVRRRWHQDDCSLFPRRTALHCQRSQEVDQ
jgi:Acyl-CoA dehydrogenase, N-terminal domain